MPKLQPTIRKLPWTGETLAESNLPFSCVITPLQQLERNFERRISHPPLVSVPRCSKCGAPHPTQETHFLPYNYTLSSPTLVMCYFCGHISHWSAPPPKQTVASPTCTFQLPLLQAKKSLPAMACPPVCWFLLDASCTHRGYWKTLAHVLLHTLKDVPPHVHIGILLAAATSETSITMSHFDLTSTIPHLMHFALEVDTNNDTADDGGLMDKMCIVPADALHLSNIQAALRSLVDFQTFSSFSSAPQYTQSMPLGMSIETILNFMSSRAQHPGLPPSQQHQNDDPTTNTTPEQQTMYYAGGKIITFLASSPSDLRGQDWRPTSSTGIQREIGMGGFGGATLERAHMGSSGSATSTVGTPGDDEEAGMRSMRNNNNQNHSEDPLDEAEMTPSALKEYYRPPKDIEEYFQDLGTQCAQAAFGVDLLVLAKEDDQHRIGMDVGLPFLRPLTDRSGAPGPLLFPLDQLSIDPDFQLLQKEVCARVPWGKHPMAFAGELRLRLSSGFSVDQSTVSSDSTTNNAPKLVSLYQSGGLMGPAVVEEESADLWQFGTCDPFTSVTVDLDVHDRQVKDSYHLDGFGEVKIKPSIQACFAYTRIVQDKESEEYYTVREMRISSLCLPLTKSVETLYSSVDPEAVAVVLYHKLAMTLLRDGASMVPEIGEDWLRSLLTCAYKSAEFEKRYLRALQEHGMSNENPHFYVNERLLDQEGELSAEDVLLAQGHELLKSFPLIMYSLLTCNAISAPPLGATCYPTVDARSAAAIQMSSMTPSILSKCINPTLQLWSAGNGELILDMIDLRMDAIQLAVKEYTSDSCGFAPDRVLFLNSPSCLVICTVSYIFPDANPIGTQITIGKKLEEVITNARDSYRTPPPMIWDLDSTFVNSKGFPKLLNALVEDYPDGYGAQNFRDWKESLAVLVNDDLGN